MVLKLFDEKKKHFFSKENEDNLNIYILYVEYFDLYGVFSNNFIHFKKYLIKETTEYQLTQDISEHRKLLLKTPNFSTFNTRTAAIGHFYSYQVK